MVLVEMAESGNGYVTASQATEAGVPRRKLTEAVGRGDLVQVARGLYARYEQEGASFVPVYCDLLSRFGSDTIEHITASVGIDVTTPDFWRSAVASVVAEAERFTELVG